MCIIHRIGQTSVNYFIAHFTNHVTLFPSTLYKYPHKNLRIIKHICHQFVQIIVTVDIGQKDVQKHVKQILQKKPNH
jgi:hypothetical protein